MSRRDTSVYESHLIFEDSELNIFRPINIEPALQQLDQAVQPRFVVPKVAPSEFPTPWKLFQGVPQPLVSLMREIHSSKRNKQNILEARIVNIEV